VSQLYLALGQGDKIIAGSDAIRLRVMWPSTPAEWQCLTWRHCSMLRVLMETGCASAS